MESMKKLTVIKMVPMAMVVLLLLLQVAPVSAAKPKDRSAWTFMVYIVGDNDLEKYVTLDIESELAQPGSNSDVNVVVIADRVPGYDRAAGDWTGTLLFHVTQDMTATPENAVADWGERNMGDPQTLIDFVQWSQANYPAEHYAIVFWDHGWGWRPYQAMWDETDDDTLDQHEIVAAMDVVGPVDVVGYDACEMQMIEVQATWRNYAQAIVGSQEDVWWDGIEYELVVPALQANPGMTAEQLAIEIAESMHSNTERTGSAVALNSDWDNLISAVDAWSLALLDGLPAYRAAYDAAYKKTQDVFDPLNRDLYDAAAEIMVRVDDPDLQAKCQAVMDAVDTVVLHEWHRRSYPDAHGIGIFWPKVPEDLDEPSSPQWNDFEYYRNYLAFAPLTHWDEFLDAYVNQ
jgi:hypothetical protein